MKEEVPAGDYTVPLGQARIARTGRHVPLIAWGSMVSICQKAADQCAQDGIECRSSTAARSCRLDEATILESVKKTGRAVVVYEAPKTSGFWRRDQRDLAERAIEWLRRRSSGSPDSTRRSRTLESLHARARPHPRSRQKVWKF